MRLHTRIKSCLATWEIQLLNFVEFFENFKGFVNCCKADCRMDLPNFIVDSLHGWMFSAMECKSTNRYSLWSSFVSFLAESIDYGCVEFFVVVHTGY